MTVNLSSRKPALRSVRLPGIRVPNVRVPRVRRLVPSRQSTLLFTKTVCVGTMIAGGVLFVNSCVNSGSSKLITPAGPTVSTISEADRILQAVNETNREAVRHQCELLHVQLNDTSKMSDFAKEHLTELYHRHCEVAS